MVEVTQEDREAAAKVAKMQSRYAKAANMKLGNCDTSPFVQLMARHRTTALAAKEAENAELRAKVEKLREALQDIAWPARLPSDGDPTVLRNHALAALAETQP